MLTGTAPLAWCCLDEIWDGPMVRRPRNGYCVSWAAFESCRFPLRLAIDSTGDSRRLVRSGKWLAHGGQRRPDRHCVMYNDAAQGIWRRSRSALKLVVGNQFPHAHWPGAARKSKCRSVRQLCRRPETRWCACGNGRSRQACHRGSGRCRSRHGLLGRLWRGRNRNVSGSRDTTLAESRT